MLRFVVIICVMLASCCGLQNKIIYRYGDIVITRIDECGKTSFFYGNNQQGASQIAVKYSGINDGFSGYLKFNEDGKVFLLSGDGSFTMENVDTTKFDYKRISGYERPELGGSVCVISLAIENEKEKNSKAKTKVMVEYHIDKNEWW